MALRQRGLPHERGNHRDIHRLRKYPQLFLGRGVVDPAAGQNQGPLGLFQLLQDRADNPVLRASPPGNGIRPVNGVCHNSLCLQLVDIIGHLNMYWSRSSRLHQLESFWQEGGQLSGGHSLIALFNIGLDSRGEIRLVIPVLLLEGSCVKLGQGGLPGKLQKRR